MPNIPTRIASRAPGNLTPGAGARAAPVAINPLAIAGERLAAIATKFQEEEDKRAVADLKIKQSRDWLEFKTGLQGRTDYQSFEAEYTEFSRQWREQNLAGHNATVQRAYATTFGQIDLQGLASIRDSARRIQIDTSKAELDASLSDALAAYSIEQDPDAKATIASGALESIATRMETGIISATQAESLRQKWELNFARSDTMAEYYADPWALREKIVAGDLPHLAGKERVDWLMRTETRINTLETKAARERAAHDKRIAGEYEGYISFLELGGDPDKLPMHSMDLGLTLDRFNDPAIATEANNRVRSALVASAAIREARTAPLADRASIIQSYIQGVTSRVEGAPERAKEAKLVVDGIRRDTEALLKDPAKYAIENLEEVGNAHGELTSAMEAGDPGRLRRAVDEYVAAQASAQERLQIPTDDRRLLPPGYAGRIAQQVGDFTEGGERAARTVNDLRETWGNHWPDVYRELAASEALPGAALVIASVEGPENDRVRTEIASAVSAGSLKQMPKADANDLRESVAGNLNDLRASMTTVGGIRAFPVYQDTATELAAYYMRREGLGVSDAAAKATAAIIDNRYSFETANGATYRIPNIDPRSGVPINAARVQTGANRALYSLRDFDIAIPPGAADLHPDDARENYLNDLELSGYWVTAPDESGLTLYDARDRAAVVREDGNPFRLSWSELDTITTATDAVTRMRREAPDRGFTPPPPEPAPGDRTRSGARRDRPPGLMIIPQGPGDL